MWKTLNVGEVEIYLPNDKYCNSCRFRKYVNHEIKYICLLLGGSIERDGMNFIRLKRCYDAEEKCVEMLDSGEYIPEEMCIACALQWLNEEAE